MRSCQQVIRNVHNFREPTPNTGDTQFILSSANDSSQMIHSAFSSALVTYFPSQCAVSCCVFFVDWLFIRFTVLPFFEWARCFFSSPFVKGFTFSSFSFLSLVFANCLYGMVIYVSRILPFDDQCLLTGNDCQSLYFQQFWTLKAEECPSL